MTLMERKALRRGSRDQVDPPRLNTRQRVRELEEEVTRLSELLGVPPIRSLDEWRAIQPDELRAQFAARAFIDAYGITQRALAYLSFAPALIENAHTAEAVFRDDPLVAAEIATYLEDVHAQKPAILQRMAQITRASAPAVAGRIFKDLARVAGWVGPETVVNVDRREVNLWQVVAQVQGEDPRPIAAPIDLTGGDPLALLDHEPALAGVRVASDTGDRRLDARIDESDS